MSNAVLRRGVERLAIDQDLEGTLQSILIDAVAASLATSGALCLRTEEPRLEIAAFVRNGQGALPQPGRAEALRGMPAVQALNLLELLEEGPRHAIWEDDIPPYAVVDAREEAAPRIEAWLFPFSVSGQAAGFLELASPGAIGNIAQETVIALAQHAGLAVEKSRASHGDTAHTDEAALQRAAKLTEANAALKRSLDVLASQTSVDRFLAHVLAEIGGRLGAQWIVLWLAEGEQAPTMGSRLCWSDGRVSESRMEDLLGVEAANALMRGAARFRQLRFPLLRPVKACAYLTSEEIAALERAGVAAILHLPLILGRCFLGAVSVLFGREVDIATEDLDLVQAFAHQATLAVRLAQLSTEAQNAAITRERARMSREIHDTITQTFIGIIRNLKGHDGRVPDIPSSLSLAELGLAEARRAVSAMRPSLLEDKPLVDALQDLASSVATDRLRATVTSSGTPTTLMPESEGNLFRIVQEAVNNVVNHASATELAIDVSFLPGELTVLVSDNGQGFHLADIDSEQGFGLFSMKQRAQAIGADLQMVSAPGQGTQVYVSWRATGAEQESLGRE